MLIWINALLMVAEIQYCLTTSMTALTQILKHIMQFFKGFLLMYQRYLICGQINMDNRI